MKAATLVYSIVCDDVRLEMGNKLSLMGLFENIFLPQFPSALLKFAIVNHWIGEGDFETHLKVLAPDRREHLQVRLEVRSEEHTSELQSPCNLVCRLLLEKKKRTHSNNVQHTTAHNI